MDKVYNISRPAVSNNHKGIIPSFGVGLLVLAEAVPVEDRLLLESAAFWRKKGDLQIIESDIELDNFF